LTPVLCGTEQTAASRPQTLSMSRRITVAEVTVGGSDAIAANAFAFDGMRFPGIVDRVGPPTVVLHSYAIVTTGRELALPGLRRIGDSMRWIRVSGRCRRRTPVRRAGRSPVYVTRSK
jgi:hypothetical protein